MKFSIAFLVILVVSLTRESAKAFVTPRPNIVGGHPTSTGQQHRVQEAPTFLSTSCSTSSLQLSASASNLVDGKQLTTFFLETLISNGVPALCTVLVIAFAANAFRSKEKEQQREDISNNPITELYNDLYGDSSAKKRSPFFNFGKPPQQQAQNTGVPSQEYIKIQNRNDRLDSYQYSMNAATQSKALAASEARFQNFDKALSLGLSSSFADLTPSQKSSLLQVEQKFLKAASGVATALASLQTELTKSTIEDEMKTLGVTPTEMDPKATSATNETLAINATNMELKEKKAKFEMLPFVASKKSKQLKEVTLLQETLLRLELKFVQEVIQVLGPERANGVKAALLGDVAARGAGGLLSQMQDRPLTVLLNEMDGDEEGRRKSLFVTQFPGDPTASQVADLREEVTAIVRNKKPGDEALVVLQTGGGTVTGYGLAASQLQRFKENGMKLTICVEQVAASGGYMMACVADKIISSPFAVLGSIGVISDIPNVYQRLKEEGIEFQTITAGKYKRTITPTKKVTTDDMKKSKEDIEEVLKLFKTFVKENRPSLDIEKVATGETWFGTDALERNLCDEIKTVDEVVTEYIDAGYNVYDVKYEPPPEAPSLSNLIPVGAESSGSGGIVSRAARWLARTVAAEFRSEIDNLSSSQRPDRKYMMEDDSSDRIRAE